ncbi:hypothetical protein [Hyphomicrobium sp.]|uniref:hypothetical protein n=1 Tax=Hyphomicrobium sp. TaxID=82 RepID=UPI000F9EE66D|nr:hypothetical protein [Hyphomicrobium sp.]RUO98499.1 MAG: hypothetical protein EKK30_11855 [Hyphomicrobium sp.]
MTRDATGALRFGTGTTAAVVTLMATSYLVLSGTSARPQSSESTTEISNAGGWVTTASSTDAVAPSTQQQRNRNETIVPKQYLGGDVKAGGNQEASAKNAKSGEKKRSSTKGAFRDDPKYSKKYDAAGQTDIYGGKTAVEPPRPLLEIGREQYTSGIYDESSTLFGKLNPLLPGLSVYGDWRTAMAYNSNNGKDIAQVATRLNLDVDLKITATERIHAFFTPFQDGNAKFTRFEFSGGDGDGRFTDELDFDPQTLFFEGDLGSIYSGVSGKYAGFDLPFTVGLFPLFLQNGIWANDAILGGAVTFPAKNSSTLGLSNYDLTFFAAFDNVDNASLIGVNGKVDNDHANLFGVTTFVDAFNGYVEAGYGFIQGTGAFDNVEQHFLTAAYSRRYANTISNSTRLFANFGDDGHGNGDGFAFISENSLISPLPLTLLPYANFFVGVGNPEPLVDGNNAGILKNVGINFETDALTGYPKLDDTASNTFGGALGVEYLFNLDQQLVFEVATVQPFENDGIGAKAAQYGFGVRYQIPITRSWLFRADATYQIQEGQDDNFGFRTELRSKF